MSHSSIPATTNGDSCAPPRPLEVIVIGAGIAGLTVGIALRKNGHHVKIYEQSRFAQELGAAVHVAPNAHGLLKKLGVDPQVGANKVEWIREFTASGELNREIDLSQSAKLWQHDWLSAHRVRLHEALKEEALSEDGPGRPCELHLSSSVVNVDPHNASITLKGGTKISADVVIGADGVHSKSRRNVPGGENAKTVGSGKNGFRFMIPRKDVLNDPITRPLFDKPGQFSVILGTDRRIITYPTSDNTLLNFLCIHPEEMSDPGDDSWSTETSRAAVLDVYRDFAPEFLALLEKANAESLKVWKLLDMENLPGFVNGRFALIGDAAHPFLPHQGQGAAMAMEDAVALSVVLEPGLACQEIPERLKLYNSIRYERACKVQEVTRIAGQDIPDKKLDTIEHRKYNFGHDEFHNSAQRLREWKWARMNKSALTMPVAFAPILTTLSSSTSSPSFVTASIQFRTSKTLLRNFLPSGVPALSFEAPGTVVTCSFAHTSLDGLGWLDGGRCESSGLYIHDVSYDTSYGKKFRGTYVPVIFNNQTDCIVRDREHYGLNAVYSSMNVEHDGNRYHASAFSNGHAWAELALEDLQPVPSDALAALGTPTLAGTMQDEGLLTWRCSPTFDTKTPDFGLWIPFKQGDEDVRVTQAWKTEKATIRFESNTSLKRPILAEVASRLSEIPVFDVLSAHVVTGTGIPSFGQPQRI
ncbi:hypothetical protein H2204_015133 [Knufia peltigerae]|uniref:FAD-binding domain-containing protein n=1 Tax=Knufia peltigerae TaxID=1002370 RepID=A0AA39CL17_9EURO|nr:hypothetical protein H2204_015133 [Knufia peltigerae]